jgi:DNA-binding IclR family transcriptional regulator
MSQASRHGMHRALDSVSQPQQYSSYVELVLTQRERMSTSAGRTLDLLSLVATSDRPLGLMNLVEMSGMDKSTTSRLLNFLVNRGYLMRDPLTKRYEVGAALVAFAAAALNRSELRTTADHLLRLCTLTGETTSLHLRVGTERICIDGAESPQPVRRVLSIGERVPLYLSPTGKVILAFLAPADAQPALAAARAAGIDMPALEATLARIRTERYMAAIGDRTPGVAAVSVPLSDRNGNPVASLTIAGPGDRWTMARMLEFLPQLKAAAALISPRFGVTAA